MKLCPHCHEWDLSDREAKQIAQLHVMAPVTAESLSKRHGLSVQNASNRLRKWQKAGFLDRQEREQPSGGIEFVYTVPKRKP